MEEFTAERLEEQRPQAYQLSDVLLHRLSHFSGLPGAVFMAHPAFEGAAAFQMSVVFVRCGALEMCGAFAMCGAFVMSVVFALFHAEHDDVMVLCTSTLTARTR